MFLELWHASEDFGEPFWDLRRTLLMVELGSGNGRKPDPNQENQPMFKETEAGRINTVTKCHLCVWR
jgi:hypothetical protein